MIYYDMDWLTFQSNIIHDLVWPLFFLIALFVFKSPIIKLLESLYTFKERLEKAKFSGIELELDRKLNEAVENSMSISANADVKYSTKELRSSYELAEISPRASINEAWRHVEIAGIEAAKRALEGRAVDYLWGRKFISLLFQNKKINLDVANQLNKLLGIRNEATHAPGFIVSKDFASEYINLSEQMISILNSIGN